jgi:hypothetical protein
MLIYEARIWHHHSAVVATAITGSLYYLDARRLRADKQIIRNTFDDSMDRIDTHNVAASYSSSYKCAS